MEDAIASAGGGGGGEAGPDDDHLVLSLIRRIDELDVHLVLGALLSGVALLEAVRTGGVALAPSRALALGA